MSKMLPDMADNAEQNNPYRLGALKLRPFQEDVIKSVLDALKHGKQLILVQLASGTGRSLIIRQLLNSYPLLERPVTILVNSKEEVSKLKSILRDDDNEELSILSNVKIEVKSNFNYRSTNDVKSRGLLITIDVTLNKNEFMLEDDYGSVRNSFANIISFTSTEPSEDEMFYYDQPVYKYTINDAIADGVLVPVEGHLCRAVPNIVSLSDKSIVDILSPFTNSFLNNEVRKAIVLCPSYDAAEKVRIALDHLYPHVTTITSKETASVIKEKLNAFSNPGASFIAVSAGNFLIGVDIPSLTDLVICKKFKTRIACSQAIARVTRPSPGKVVSHVWDFGGNQQFISEIVTRIDEEHLLSERSSNTTELPQDDDLIEPSAKIQIQRLVLPVGDNVSDIDMLGRGRLLHVLQGLIRDTEKRNFRPFVIGIFGKWGAGKSTVVNLLQKLFKDDKRFRFVTFNAWQSEHCTNMGAALAHKLVEQLYNQKNVFKRIFYSLFYNLLLEKDKVGVFILLFGVVAIATAFTINTDDTFKLIKIDTTVYGIDKKGFFTFFVGFVALLGKGLASYLKHPFNAKINKIINKPSYSAHLGTAEQVKQEICAVIKARSFLRNDMWKYITTPPWESFRHDFKPEANKQFIVIIDDLDRCSDSKIVEVLEAVRLIIDLPNVVVILTVDQSIMISAVANKFSQQNKNLKWERALALARDFLGKIIQISIELEAPDSRQTRHFVANRLYPETSTIEEIATHISSGRNLDAESEEENAFNQAFEEATESPLKLKTLFLGMDVFDEDITDIEPSSEYLTHSAREVEVFSKCVGAFNICNPRTLVRLHNTITVLKGLNPELVDDNELLDIHIFMAFVQEAFAMRSDPKWSELDGLFTSTTSLDSPYCSRVKKLSRELGISTVLNSEIVKIAGRLRRLSLTSVAMMISEGPEQDERAISN